MTCWQALWNASLAVSFTIDAKKNGIILREDIVKKANAKVMCVPTQQLVLKKIRLTTIPKYPK